MMRMLTSKDVSISGGNGYTNDLRTLKVKTNARKIDLGLNANLTQLFRITDPRPLQDQWRA